MRHVALDPLYAPNECLAQELPSLPPPPQPLARLRGALRGGVELEAEAAGRMGLSTSEVGELIVG